MRPVNENGLGSRIRDARTALGWSLARLAEECQRRGHRVTAQAINEVELGHTKDPTLRIVRALSETLSIDLLSQEVSA